MTQQTRDTTISLLLFLPFFVLNLLVGRDNETIDRLFHSVFSLDGLRTNPLGHLIAISSILLIPVGSAIALRSAARKRPDDKRWFNVVNLILGSVTLLFFVVVTSALIMEVYRCDVLLIPNCD
jgi:hypothetical protein